MRCDNCGWDNQDGTTLCIKCKTPLLNILPEKKPQPAGTPATPFQGTITDGSPHRSASPVFGGTIVDSQSQSSAADNWQEANTTPEPSGGQLVNFQSGDPLANSRSGGDPQQNIPKPCPKCRYENSPQATICVICKTPLNTATTPAPANLVAPPAPPAPVAPANAIQLTVPDRGPIGPPATGLGTIDPYRMKTQAPLACYLQLVPREKEKLDASSVYKKFISTDEPIQLNRNNLEEKNNSITSKVQAEILYEDGKWYLSDRSEFRTTFINVNERTELREGDTILIGDRKFTFTTSTSHDDLPQ